jgi:hypothetical protein
MFISGITADSLIKGVMSEVNIAKPISIDKYLEWYNECEQTLYTEYIREEKRVIVYKGAVNGGVIPIPLPLYNTIYGIILHEDDEEIPIIEDVAEFRLADENEHTYAMKKSVPHYATKFKDLRLWWKEDNQIGFYPPNGLNAEDLQEAEIIYYVRPKRKETNDGAVTGMFNLPDEFHDLMEAKLRGEAYNYINNFGQLAAPWLAVYNARLEDFNVWLQSKNAVTNGRTVFGGR